MEKVKITIFDKVKNEVYIDAIFLSDSKQEFEFSSPEYDFKVTHNSECEKDTIYKVVIQLKSGIVINGISFDALGSEISKSILNAKECDSDFIGVLDFDYKTHHIIRLDEIELITVEEVTDDIQS